MALSVKFAPLTKFWAMLEVLPMLIGPAGPGTVTAPKRPKEALKLTFWLFIRVIPGLSTVIGEAVTRVLPKVAPPHDIVSM
jgi:hypothetical protein